MKIDLKGWQACFAIRQNQFNNPSLKVQINESIKLFGQSVSVNLELQSLSVEILDHGQDLIRLHLPAEGSFSLNGNATSLNGTMVQVTTTFTVAEEGEYKVVVPVLNGKHVNIELKDCPISHAQLAALNQLLSKWTQKPSSALPLELFRFKKNAGNGTGANFDYYKVTSTYARFAPVHSSIILLMKNGSAQSNENELAIDPHILPTGQDKVLWVSKDTLTVTGGSAFVEAAKTELALRPRPMNAQIHNVSQNIKSWSAAFMSDISLPSGLEFTSMEMREEGLMLSATPLSIEEFDSFTAVDETLLEKNPVQEETDKLFHKCVLHYMEEDYLKNLMQEERPTLEKEVKEISQKSSKWYERYGRLQLGVGISKSDAKDIKPFKEIDGEKAIKKLQEVCMSEEYIDQTSKLNSLAFCIVHPRASIYMEQPKQWKDPYYDFITSTTFTGNLFKLNNPVSKIHDAVSKMNLFDLSGDTSREALGHITNNFMFYGTVTNFSKVVTDFPETVSFAVEKGVEMMQAEAQQVMALSATDPSSVSDEKKEEAEAILKAIDNTGSVSGLSAEIIAALKTIARQDGYMRLLDESDDLNRFQKYVHDTFQKHPKIINRSANICRGIAVVAVFAVFISSCINTAEEVENKSLDDEAIAKMVVTTISDVMSVGFASIELAVLTGKATRSIATKSWSVLSTLATKMVGWHTTASQAIAEGVKNASKGLYKFCGAVMSLLVATIAIWDAVNDGKKGNYGAMTVDILIAIVALAQFVVFCAAASIPYSGPIAVGLAAVGIILGVIRFFAFQDDNKQKEAGENLAEQLENDYQVVLIPAINPNPPLSTQNNSI